MRISSHEEAGYMTATDTSLTRLHKQSCVGERSIYDPLWRGLLRNGGLYAGGGGSSGDPGSKPAREEHSRDCAHARGFTQYSPALFAPERPAALPAASAAK